MRILKFITPVLAAAAADTPHGPADQQTCVSSASSTTLDLTFITAAGPAIL
ncbi:MAG: hypothetical protein QOE41_1688 [Mycobacterium sp.]|jgi:hypothetical protein|nr:hypothetical protein [Mycobacterium sp.]MDT5132377.1 hypothetical protein [Mycobacterium sp.]